MPMVERIIYRKPAESVQKDAANGQNGPKPISLVGGGRAGSLIAFTEGRGGQGNG